jgi:hypothetical protein
MLPGTLPIPKSETPTITAAAELGIRTSFGYSAGQFACALVAKVANKATSGEPVSSEPWRRGLDRNNGPGGATGVDPGFNLTQS